MKSYRFPFSNGTVAEVTKINFYDLWKATVDGRVLACSARLADIRSHLSVIDESWR